MGFRRLVCAISGKPVKSINQYYHKATVHMQKGGESIYGKNKTKRQDKLTAKRNHKIKDYMHKAGRKIVEMAVTQL